MPEKILAEVFLQEKEKLDTWGKKDYIPQGERKKWTQGNPEETICGVFSQRRGQHGKREQTNESLCLK